jgi:HAD superfamily phosphatase (TIGR01668 family)
MTKLIHLLTPTVVVETIGEVDPEALKARGITAIITDLDNTLVPWRHYEIADGVTEWLHKLEEAGIKICIASNTLHMKRLKQLAETMGIPFVDRVRKPHPGGFIRSMKAMGSNRHNTAVFGDQIFTDVLAGNRLGLTTILLRPPLSREEFVSTQMVRHVENIVIRWLKVRGRWPGALILAEALERHQSELAVQSVIQEEKPETRRSLFVPAAILAAVSVLAVTWWRRRRP